LLLAAATFVVVLQARLQRKTDDRHHQDGFRPICTLDPHDGVHPRYSRDTLLSIVDQQFQNQGFGILEVRCALRNIGARPALNLGIIFRFLDMNGYSTDVWELSPLRAGECRGSKETPLRIPLPFGKHFNQTDFSQVPGKLWEIILVYEDIFGNHFHSIRQKRPLQLDKLHSVTGSSEFATPSQSWVTFDEGKFPA
jgi:hypothetical protein